MSSKKGFNIHGASGLQIDFGSISGQGQALKKLPIPEELLQLINERNDVIGAERWLREHLGHPLCQPYMVHMSVQDSRFALYQRPICYFIRATRLNADNARDDLPGPTQAGQIAHELWKKWEKPPTPEGQMPPPYPDIVGHADIVVIDEQDWEECLKTAHRLGGGSFYCFGAPKFPFYWTCTGLPFEDYAPIHLHPDHNITVPWETDPGYDSRGEIVEP